MAKINLLNMLYLFSFAIIFCFTIWLGYALIQYSKFIACMKRVEGVIKEVVYDEDIECQFSVSFAYEYKVNEKLYSSPRLRIGRGSQGSNNLINISELRNKYSEGNEIMVVYDRKNPEISEVLDGLFYLKVIMLPFIFIAFVYIAVKLFGVL